MKRILFYFTILSLPFGILGQELHLNECIREALAANPLAGNQGLADKIAIIRKEVITKSWLPILDLNAQATWQSDVVSFSLDLPFPVEFPQIPKDQYKIALDINQLIYEGGSIRAQKSIEDLAASISKQELAVQEHELIQVVEDLYFAILMVNERISTIDLMTGSLESTILQVQSGVNRGILTEADLSALAAEKIRLGQQKIRQISLKDKAVRSLGLLMGKDLPGSPVLVRPQPPNPGLDAGNRPEYRLFSLQDDLLKARSNLLNTQLRPKLAAFTQAGYGKPGLNFLGESWDPYILVGMRFSWPVWDWGKVRGQKNVLTVNQRILANQINAFTRQVNMAAQEQTRTVEEINSLLVTDFELLAAREKITAAFGSRLNNGLITSSTYLNEWTKEQEARINLEARKIELLSAQYRLASINGNDKP